VVVNIVDKGPPLPDDDAARAAVADLDAPAAKVLLDAAAFRRSRRAMESEELARLAAELPIPQVHLPARLVAGLTPADIDVLGAVISHG
jgi:hypothetical protein